MVKKTDILKDRRTHKALLSSKQPWTLTKNCLICQVYFYSACFPLDMKFNIYSSFDLIPANKILEMTKHKVNTLSGLLVEDRGFV